MLIKDKIKSIRVDTERFRRLTLNQCNSNTLEEAVLGYDKIRDYLRRVLEEFTNQPLFISHQTMTDLSDIPDKTDIPATGYTWNVIGPDFTDVQKLAYLHLNTGALAVVIKSLEKDVEAYVNTIRPVLPELKVFIEQASLTALETQALIYSELNRLKDANL